MGNSNYRTSRTSGATSAESVAGDKRPKYDTMLVVDLLDGNDCALY